MGFVVRWPIVRAMKRKPASTRWDVEALMSVRKNASMTKESILEHAQDKLKDLEKGKTECAVFQSALSEAIQQQANLEACNTVTQTATALMHKVVDRKWDEMIQDLHGTLENPWIIANGWYIKQDFESWVTQVTEVRYSRYVEIKMVVEAAQHNVPY